MRLSSLTDVGVFLLLETPEGRRHCGKRHLCDAYKTQGLCPAEDELEMELVPGVTTLQVRRQQPFHNSDSIQHSSFPTDSVDTPRFQPDDDDGLHQPHPTPTSPDNSFPVNSPSRKRGLGSGCSASDDASFNQTPMKKWRSSPATPQFHSLDRHPLYHTYGHQRQSVSPSGQRHRQQRVSLAGQQQLPMSTSSLTSVTSLARDDTSTPHAGGGYGLGGGGGVFIGTTGGSFSGGGSVGDGSVVSGGGSVGGAFSFASSADPISSSSCCEEGGEMVFVDVKREDGGTRRCNEKEGTECYLDDQTGDTTHKMDGLQMTTATTSQMAIALGCKGDVFLDSFARKAAVDQLSLEEKLEIMKGLSPDSLLKPGAVETEEYLIFQKVCYEFCRACALECPMNESDVDAYFDASFNAFANVFPKLNTNVDVLYHMRLLTKRSYKQYLKTRGKRKNDHTKMATFFS